MGRWADEVIFSIADSLDHLSDGLTWTTVSGNGYCPKCGKPYTYIGDVVGDPKSYICQCDVNIPSVFGVHLQGWECPRCHQINAPFVQKCDCKPATVSVTTTNTVKTK